MDTIKIKLCQDVAKVFKIEENLVYENTSKSFFNAPYNASAEELLYLYFYFKKNYSINLDANKIKAGAFKNIDGIYELLK